MMSYVDDELPLWPLAPNWKREVKETLEFRTRVLGPTLTGVRQKRRMRKAPRRSFEFEAHPHHASRRFLDNVRFSLGVREWLLPIWPDRQKLSAPLSAGSASIPCATAGYDFAVGSRAVLRPSSVFTTEFEIVVIESIDVDAINLVGVTANAWPAGTHLYPVRKGRVSLGRNSVSLLSGEVSTMTVSMDISEPCDWAEHTFDHTYRGRPVWEFRTNWRSGRNFEFNRVVDTLDNDVSSPLHYDFSGKTFAGIDASWLVEGREQHTVQREVAYALAGRYLGLWVPTLADDLQVVGTMGAGSTALPVAYCGYTTFCLGMHGRRDIRIELTNGVVYYRRITDSEESGGAEQLTLNSSLGVEVSASNIRRISFMMLMQQASDSLTINHHTDADGAATATLVFEGITETT